MKVINISHLVNEEDNTLTLEISNNQTGEVKVDWHDLPESENYHLVTGDNTNLEILELNEKNSHVIYDIGENSKVKLNIFNSVQGESLTREFNIQANASLEVAFADFSVGDKSLKVDANLLSEGASIYWHLATISEKNDKKNFVINFNHLAGNTFAKMENYGVAKDNSTLNFLGNAKIFKGSKGSSTNQLAKILVFDKGVHAKASPMLCIDENDVKAFHGASEGQINKDHIFYLMSRGVSEAEAKKLITYGYLYPIIQTFTEEDIKNAIVDCITKRV